MAMDGKDDKDKNEKEKAAQNEMERGREGKNRIRQKRID